MFSTSSVITFVLFVSLISFSFSSIVSSNGERVVFDDTRRTDTFDIDVFPLSNNGPLIINVPSGTDINTEELSISAHVSSSNGNSIIGGERDVFLEVTEVEGAGLVSASVYENELELANSNNIASHLIITYDGIDGDDDINPNGLGDMDFTVNGGDAFHFLIQSDLTTSFIITVYSAADEVSKYTLVTPGNVEAVDFYAPFNLFSGNADFTSVGAIVLEIDGPEQVDVILQTFSISAPMKKVYLTGPGNLCFEENDLVYVGSSSDSSDDEENTTYFDFSFNPVIVINSLEISTTTTTSSSTTSSNSFLQETDETDFFDNIGNVGLSDGTDFLSNYAFITTAQTTNDASSITVSFLLVFFALIFNFY